MANHGAKFVSVNLNKSYGQQHQPSHHSRYPHFNGGGSSYGQATAAGRSRGGSGGGGGMVVLSRNRGGPAKVVSKLSVPPPLNLPSLRKEHEKFDISGSGGPGAGAGTGSGARPTSSGVGWTKPVAAATALPEKIETGVGASGADGMDAMDGAIRGIGSYMPPSARSSGVGGVASASESQAFAPSAEKAVVLRGEDFPSLQAARPVSSGASQKQKEVLNQKQKQVLSEELTQDKRDSYHLGPLVDMHPLGHSSKNMGGNGLLEIGGGGRAVSSGQMADHFQKEEKFPDPLPLVNVILRSDWADDERDTGRGLMDRGRDNGHSNPENYWDRDFDLPRPSILPHKPAQNQYNRWGQRDNETGKNFSSEVLKMDPFNKDVRASSQEGRESSKWRTPTFSKDGFSSQEVGNYNIDVGARMNGQNNLIKENKYIPPHSGEIGRDGNAPPNRDSAFGRRDMGVVGRQQQQQQRNYLTESSKNKGAERNSWDLHTNEQSNRPRGIDYQNSTFSKSSASSGKMLPITDPILTMGRDKRFSKGDRAFSEDPFLRDYGSADFDDKGDIFSGGLVGVIKRKKDAAKPTDFHDPVRESFEAELERVQKMQELERQRIIEEQERALEQARREEEERQRRIREEEERRRRLEEEAQEAAWRAEQERLDAIQRAEEQRIAREEEKKRIQLEEERRKQAARQKLQELEAKMAKRQAEASKGSASVSKTIVDEKPEAIMQEKHASRNLDLETWEDGERMVENMTSGSFDSSPHIRSPEMSLKPYTPREGASNFIDRGKAINSWRRDAFENGSSLPSPLTDQDIGAYNPTRGAFGGSRAAYRKEFHGGSMPSRQYFKVGMQEPYPDEFGFQKDQRWSFSGNADSYGKLREMDSEFPDNIADKYSDNGWGNEYSHGNNRPPYPERLYPHSDANELYSYGRSRYSMRQPRVLPPPLALAQRSGVIERTNPSTFQDESIHYTHAARAESTRQTAYYGGNQGGHEPSEIFGLERENVTSEEQKLNNASRCDSQSSLSVSSPPTSPPHLSHDEFDESGESPVTSAVAEGRRSLLPGAASVDHNGISGNGTEIVASDSLSAVEDEDWTLENDDRMQQQEEYDEDEDGYREEDEVREGDEENLELNQKFEGLELNQREPPHMMDNVVLGFDEGVQVVIPSDGSEKNIGSQERSYGVPASVTDIVDEKEPADGLPSDDQCVLPPDDSLGTVVDICSGKVPEKSALHGTIGHSAGAPYSLASTDPDATDTSDGVGLTSKPTFSSSGDATSARNHINLPSSSSGNQGDLPVKLQFGLFSGPSLIPSPVPAIQIGSIQMPLHIHPPVGPSVTHMHPSQTPMFQFGQLHYTSPISQGILPIAPQSMPFAQPSTMGQLNMNQNVGSSVTHEHARYASARHAINDEVPSISMNKQPSATRALPKQPSESFSQGLNTVVDAKSHESNTVVCSSSGGASMEKMKSEVGSCAEEKGHHPSDSKSYSASSKARGSAQTMRQPVGGEKNLGGLRGVGQLSGGRGKRFAYVVKNSNTRPSFQGHDMPAEPNGFLRRPRRFVQRTEFRIRENNDRKPTSLGIDDKSNSSTGKAVAGFARSGSKRGAISNRTIKQSIETEPSASGNSIPGENSGDRVAKELAKNLTSRTPNTSLSAEANLRTASEEDVDAPLQSGVVRVFKQPGIEAPSDEDDFIEVRSKRQMLNDRREQREKESKAKSRTTKPPRKPRSMRQKDIVTRSHNKLSGRASSEELRNSQLDFTKTEDPHTANKEVSTGFNATVSQPLIGTPISSEPHAIRPSQAGPVSAFANGKTECDPGQTLDNKDKVISLTQTQIGDTIKPVQYDTHVSAVGGHSSTLCDPVLPTSSILTKDKSFSSSASTINSLLAGQKIQFGAVTSPTVLPGSRVVSNVIGSPTSNQSDVQMLHNFPISQKDNTLFFEKEKHNTDSCVPIQDSEAEAEAAASAVAVAAISSDEIMGNGLGSVKGTKSFGGADIDSIATGVVGDQHLASQSRSEELLNVSLPADLSVETTPISLWPTLPSPQSSSSQMLSHFHGGPPSHFPFYEMNPLLGGPIFAFSPQEESSGTQSQPQKSTASNSGSLGNWQQGHSGLDSFYGPPAGYSGPFIGPPRGIPGVQGPPHMVVYNHFAPVGQYGQVGLSFMGTTYIPSGKQADWKNTSTTAAMPISEGDINNIKVPNVQRNAPNMTAPTQRLAPGSPLLPIPSPMPMFDVSPFQTAPDLSVQAHWGHIPASPLHSVPVSRPLQPQVENALPSQVSHGQSIDRSLTANRFTDSRTPTSSDNGPSFSIAADKSVSPFPTELGLVDSLRSTTSSSPQTVTVQSSSANANAESGKIDTTENSKNQNASSMKTQFSQKNASVRQGNNNTGYRYHRGGVSQRNNTGNELSQRRTGFHGRNQGLPAKMKQIYVAKQSTTGSSTT